MINLKKQIILTSIVGILALSFIASANSQKSAYLGLYEDQALICLKNTDESSQNFGSEECKIIQDIDLFGKEYRNTLNEEFAKGDIFDIEELD